MEKISLPKKERKGKKSRQNIAIAKKRISILFSLACEVYKDNYSLANRYILLARKIAMKYHIKLSKEQKRKICSHCYSLLIPSLSSRVRLTGKTISYYCSFCKKYTRIGYKSHGKKKKA